MPRHAVLELIRSELDASAVCLIDGATGMLLSSSRLDDACAQTNLDVIAVGCTDVIRSQDNLRAAMAIGSPVEDILVTMGDWFHVYHPIAAMPGCFIWAVVRREAHNLALSRIHLARLSDRLVEPTADRMLAG